MKKLLVFMLLGILILGAAAGVVAHYVFTRECIVFVESFGNGRLTVDSIQTEGSDTKFRVKCRYGDNLTVNINPARSEKSYYDLERLTVNGENVTDDVTMLQYRAHVTKKMTITASFKKGKADSVEEATSSQLTLDAPQIDVTGTTPYLGSLGAYNVKDPSIIFDEDSGNYYAFCSDNVVMRSKDLLNWTAKTNYFRTVTTDDSTLAFDFDQFQCVKDWAKTHGYEKDKRYASATNNRSVLAPEIVRVGKTYYLYFSLSKAEEANEAAIFCVSATDLQSAIETKDWKEVGLIVSTCGVSSGIAPAPGEEKAKTSRYDASFAVHPGVFRSEEGGMYLVYGGTWGKGEQHGAVYLLELDPKTGLLKENSAINDAGDKISTLHGDVRYRTGVLLAQPGSLPTLPKKEGSLIFGADVVRHGEYYYLFMTFGVDGRNSSIRVARSTDPAGPYRDANETEMAKFESSSFRNQATKANVLLAGYNFDKSNAGGVSYDNAGKASPASPCVFKTADGQWFVALHSQIYFKVDGELQVGERAARAAELSLDVQPAMEIRQLLWNADGWPLAVPEAYDNEQVKQSFSNQDMQGNWDVVVFDKHDLDDPALVGCSHSEMVSILPPVAVSEQNIQSGTKVDKLRFAKINSRSFELRLNGETFTVYPVVAWDWELSSPALTFTGFGDRGSTVWGKKNVSPMTGLYTDTLYYLLDQLDEQRRASFDGQLKKLAQNPSQQKVNALCAKLVKAILAV